VSRGIGRFQYQLLVVAAAYESVVGHEASVWLLQRFWSEPTPPLDVANIYRGLRALERRGLVRLEDVADYAPKCRCFDSADQHFRGQYYCEARSRHGRRCGCQRYHERVKPRAHWLTKLTEAGWALVDETDAAPVIAKVRAWSDEADEALAGLKAAVQGK
jgi:hypothetical protein